MQISIYDINGKLVFNKYYSETKPIDLSKEISYLNKGVYIVRVKSGSEKVLNVKFIKD